MKKIGKKVLAAVALLLIVLVVAFTGFYFTRIQTIATIQQVTDYEDYNLYQMDVKYAYNIDDIIDYGITDTQSMIDAILKESLPALPVHIKAPDFGCSAFSVTDTNRDVLMGRNYDFKNNTSAMLVYCAPKNGYKSVAFAALDNISANSPEKSIKSKAATLTAPFICLDGMNEKGVSVAVLTLDSKPTEQHTGKPVIATTIALRLILDRAATTEEAVELLQNYDMYAANGRDYHFYITDASNDGRVVEYDCNSNKREMVATPVRAVTNFFEIYKEKVLPNQRNDIYGHGRERYDKIEAILKEQEGNYTDAIVWKALQAAAQVPKEGDVTSNTQWSIIYHDTDLKADIVIRRDWEKINTYDLNNNTTIIR